MSKASHQYQHLREASEWFAVLSGDAITTSERLAWQQWLDASEEHRKAWAEVESVGNMFASFQDQAEHYSAQHVLEGSHDRQLSRRQVMKTALGMAGIASLGWLGWQKTPLQNWLAYWNADYRTQVGQVNTYQLSDGVKVWLNTDSAMNRHFTSVMRTALLLNGEVLVESTQGHDARPFSIGCAHGVATALSQEARYCVRHLSQDHSVLAVYEGNVRLVSNNGGHLDLKAGEEVFFDDHAIGKITPALALYQTWVNGLLVVDDMPLEDFLKEVSRYRRGHIHVDPTLAHIRVVGSYPTQKTDLIFTMLEQALPIHVTHPLPWWTNVSAV